MLLAQNQGLILLTGGKPSPIHAGYKQPETQTCTLHTHGYQRSFSFYQLADVAQAYCNDVPYDITARGNGTCWALVTIWSYRISYGLLKGEIHFSERDLNWWSLYMTMLMMSVAYGLGTKSMILCFQLQLCDHSNYRVWSSLPGACRYTVMVNHPK